MKTFSAIWLLISLVSFAVFLRAQERVRIDDSGDFAEDQLEFDLAFSDLQIQIEEEELSADDARDLMAQWLDEKKEVIFDLEARKEALISDARALEPKPELPDTVPIFDQELPEEFLEAVDRYFRQASDAIWDGVDTGNEQNFEATRDRYANFMDSDSSRSLMEQSQKARVQIQDSQMPRPPFSDAELAELEPEERIEEEIYTKIYEMVLSPEVNLDPPKNADEWRDRYAEAQPFIDEKMLELESIRKDNRLEELEANREEISTNLENVKSK